MIGVAQTDEQGDVEYPSAEPNAAEHDADQEKTDDGKSHVLTQDSECRLPAIVRPDTGGKRGALGHGCG